MNVSSPSLFVAICPTPSFLQDSLLVCPSTFLQVGSSTLLLQQSWKACCFRKIYFIFTRQWHYIFVPHYLLNS